VIVRQPRLFLKEEKLSMNNLVEAEDPTDNQPVWLWPDSLDALVAAPDHHTLLLENDRVRVLITRIAPGDITPIHTHRWRGIPMVLPELRCRVLSRSQALFFDQLCFCL
jgi:predicted metal-dependent enzyme (double-stranded beta helix superfamily)